MCRSKKKRNAHTCSLHHPRGTTIDIVGIEASGNGRAYEEHALMKERTRVSWFLVVVDHPFPEKLTCVSLSYREATRRQDDEGDNDTTMTRRRR
jgi:hypothetical protein